MKKFMLLAMLLLSRCITHAQTIRPFLPGGAYANTNSMPADKHIKRFYRLQLNAAAFESAQASIPRIQSIGKLSNSSAIIDLPVADGSTTSFFIAGIQILSHESATEHPEISNYDIQSVDGTIKGRITYSPMGMSIFMLAPGGHQYIMPFSKDDAVDHAVYAVKDYEVPENLKVACGVQDEPLSKPGQTAERTTNVALGDCTLRTYKLAVAATGEYTSWAGSQANAIADITTTIANVSLIYELQLAIKFTLTTNNSVVFTDSTTDPYPTTGFPNTTILNNNTTTLNTNIGSANYDIGFVLNYGWNGGLAYTPAICSGNKGGGAGGLNFSTLSTIMDNLVAHEIGHMFSAQHTMSTGTDPGTCSANVNLATAYETGGGSSIMAYSGSVCTGLYYQNYPDGYFHFNSEQSILNYAISQNTCGTKTTISNISPVVTVPSASYTIPISTPFALSAAGTDADGNSLTYTFDQYNVAATYMTATPSATATSGPVFRSYPPSSASSRMFPPLANILANTTNTWEVLPSVTRTLNFKIMARDNASGGGCVAYENIAVNTNSSAGPFAITSQNSSTSFTANGSNTMTITWNVANTTAAPVSSPNVNILFSADNGQTFPYTLASATLNDGTETVLVPNINTSAGRIKVVSANNIFFDINNAPLTITSSCGASGATFSPSTNLSAPRGDAALNQGLAPAYGSVVSISGTLTSANPIANLAIGNGTAATCASYSNVFQYQTFTFQPSVTGSYTFSRTAGSGLIVFDLYQGNYSPSTPCNNYLISNYTGGSGSTSYSVNLSAGVTYVMAVGTFDNGSPALPASFTIGVTPPSGGNIYSGIPDPGAGYSYTFVIVNGSGNIQGYSATGDMSNSSSYPAGNYTVYGLSYGTSVSQATLNTYIGRSFSAFQMALLNDTICGNTSSNSRSVQVTVALSANGIELNATRNKDHAALTWQVTSEKDRSNYLVERSADGIVFNPIGNVAAKNTAGGAIYNFTDNEPFPDVNYYRIKAMDNDGTVSYSSMSAVFFRQMTAGSAVLFPNPLAEGLATVRLSRDMGTLMCRITDLNGRVLQSFRTAGQQFNIDLHTLEPGIYFLCISGTTERINVRLVRR